MLFTLDGGDSNFYYVLNTLTLVPNTVVATINSSGQLKAENGTDPLEIYGNDTISPSNSWYRLKFAPNGFITQTTDYFLISGASYNLNAPVFYDPASFVPDQPPIDYQQIQSNIVPAVTGQYTLGTAQKYYASAYIQQLFATSITSPSINLPFINAVARGIDVTGANGAANLTLLQAFAAECVTAGGGAIWFPATNSGGVAVTGRWTITNCPGLRIIMDSRMYNLDVDTPDGMRLIFASASDGVTFANCKGLKLEGFQVDGTTVANQPVIMDRCEQGYWVGGGVIQAKRTSPGCNLTLTETTGIADTGVKEFLFSDLTIDRGFRSLNLTSASGVVSGVFHCTFLRCTINQDADRGIRLEVCDNIDFISTYINRLTGSAPGVHWVKTGSYYPSQINFYGLQAGPGGVSVDSGIVYPGSITNYAMDNGQPYPVLPSGCVMPITTNGFNSPGWSIQEWLITNSMTRNGLPVGMGFRDDNGYGMGLWNNSNGNEFRWKLNSSSRRLEMEITPDGSAIQTGMELGSNGPYVPTGKRIDITDHQSTVGAAGGASALPATPSGFAVFMIGGTEFVIPYYAKT